MIEVKGKGYRARSLHQLLGLKEALEMTHLPDASEDEDDGLGDGPPQDPLVGALTGQTEAFFSDNPAPSGSVPPGQAAGKLEAVALLTYP